ncbi:uncharacterized protein BKA78DRAFT_295256 [Phyllosticta capitalensis]|uniref:uncharacterized protein n=1 Tax=Phyllosticta capitalensis TaxID=121624 RepID=UPI00312D782C
MFFHHSLADNLLAFIQSASTKTVVCLHTTSHGDALEPFPPGFRMLAGDPFQRNFTGLPVPDPPKPWTGGNVTQEALRLKAVGFNCLHYSVNPPEGTLYRHFMPDKNFLNENCSDGLFQSSPSLSSVERLLLPVATLPSRQPTFPAFHTDSLSLCLRKGPLRSGQDLKPCPIGLGKGCFPRVVTYDYIRTWTRPARWRRTSLRLDAEGAGEDAAAPATLTPKKRGRPKKAELAKDNDVVKQEPGSEVESKADSVMQGSNVADQLLAAAEAGGALLPGSHSLLISTAVHLGLSSWLPVRTSPCSPDHPCRLPCRRL